LDIAQVLKLPLLWQAIIVAIAMPLLLWLRKMPWEPRAVKALSGAVLAVGVGLFFGRAFF